MSSETESGRDKAHQATCPSCGAGLEMRKDRDERRDVEERVLSVPEIEAILAHAPRRIWPLIVLAVYTGARMDELLGLRKDDFDLKVGVVRIDGGKTFTDRVVPLHPVAVALVEPLLERWNSNLSANEVRLLIQSASRRAGMGPAMFVDLRTAFEKWLVRAGAPAQVIVSLRGTNPSTVASLYGLVGNDEKRGWITRLPSLDLKRVELMISQRQVDVSIQGSCATPSDRPEIPSGSCEAGS